MAAKKKKTKKKTASKTNTPRKENTESINANRNNTFTTNAIDVWKH